MLDPVLRAELQRVDPDLVGELVHQPLDGVRRLRSAGPAIGVGPRLVGEHRLAVELVGRELVDGVEHERAQHGHATTDEADVGTEVGEQLDLEPGDGAVLLRGEGQLLPLVTAVVRRHQGLGAGLGVLQRLAQAAGQHHGDELLRRGLQLAAEPTAHVRGDHPDLRLRDAEHGRQQEPQDVRDLGRGPHGDLLTGGVDDGGARLHEGGDQPLLAVLPLEHDAVRTGLLDGLVDVAAGAGLLGVEDPERRLVGAEVGVRQHPPSLVPPPPP